MKTKVFKFPLVLLVMVLSVVACNKEEINLNQPENSLLEADKVIKYENDVIPNQYIVVMKEKSLGEEFGEASTYPKAKQAMMREAKGLLDNHRLSGKEIMKTYAASIKGFVANLTDEEAVEIATDFKVKYVEQDRNIRIAGGPPPIFGGGGGCSPDTDNCEGPCQYSNNGETPWGISAVGGSVNYNSSQTGNVAWVIDTGIDLDHEDLNVDASRGFVSSGMKGKDASSPDDGHGHGTHCAGTIAAVSNGTGVVGVAAGATVIPVKVLDKRGSGSYSGVIEGVEYVGNNGSDGDVANMSLGGGKSQALNDAVINASTGNGRNIKIWFAIAAGNEGDDANDYSPASAEGDYVRTISAVDCALNFASFSNWGNTPVDFAAPGVSVYSTTPNNTYSTYSGTSMAAPHAAGVLLATGGNPATNGNVQCGDTCDDTPDPIISR